MATWQLDPKVVHLNHGSFGACPVEVLAVQAELRSEMERNPVAFMFRRYQPAIEASRDAVAAFVKADREGLVFVPNATYGVNSVLRSMEPQLARGCEIVVTNQTYNACRNAAALSAERVGGRLVVADIPFPVADAAQVVKAVMDVVSDRTALVLLDHVTSPTALVLPIEELVAQLEPEVPVLIDGAHAPGMVPVDLIALNASFYTANCHKWMCAPKGAAFLAVAERHRSEMTAAAVSHGYNDGWPTSGSRFHAQFDWTGTDDPTARMSVPAALEVMASHHADGWDGIRRSNHDLALQGRQIIAEALHGEIPAPASMIGSIAAMPVPPQNSNGANIFDPLTDALHHRGIEVPAFAWPEAPQRLIRISAQQYNSVSDYERLAEALVELT